MRFSAASWIVCLMFGLLSLYQAGCGIFQRSPETRYYVMTLPSDSGQVAYTRAITGPRIGVGPISLPAYLSRQQIFIRQGNSTDVRLADYDRWGENMSDGIARLLVEAMSAQLANDGGMVQPLRAAGLADWRVGVNINRFDGAPGAEVVLDANWGLYAIHGDILREGHFLSTAPAGAGIDGLVRAHGELLAQLSTVLVEAVRAAPLKNPAK